MTWYKDDIKHFSCQSALKRTLVINISTPWWVLSLLLEIVVGGKCHRKLFQRLLSDDDFQFWFSALIQILCISERFSISQKISPRNQLKCKQKTKKIQKVWIFNEKDMGNRREIANEAISLVNYNKLNKLFCWSYDYSVSCGYAFFYSIIHFMITTGTIFDDTLQGQGTHSTHLEENWERF